MRGITVAVAAVAGAWVLTAGMVTVAAGATAAGVAATVAGIEAPLPANAALDPGVLVNSVSCASAGNCTAVGRYTDSSGNQQGLLLTQTAGTWKAAKAPLPAGAAADPGVALSSISCASQGNCTAVGKYADSSGNEQGLLVTQASVADMSLTNTGLPDPAGLGRCSRTPSPPQHRAVRPLLGCASRIGCPPAPGSARYLLPRAAAYVSPARSPEPWAGR